MRRCGLVMGEGLNEKSPIACRNRLRRAQLQEFVAVFVAELDSSRTAATTAAFHSRIERGMGVRAKQETLVGRCGEPVLFDPIELRRSRFRDESGVGMARLQIDRVESFVCLAEDL